MASINFVPDDYIQNNESRRVNILCVVLLLLVVGGLVSAFLTIKVRQKACLVQEAIINAKMARMQQALTQFEQLQVKREEMMKSAITIAELLEPVPRSILLATLTNNLPPGASLLELDITQTDPGPPESRAKAKTSNYQAAKATTTEQDSESLERRLITNVNITGIAMTDLQVASYIKQLDDSSLMEQVALVESQEHKIDDDVFRKFSLTARIAKDIHLTPSQVDSIRKRAQKSVLEF